MNDDFEPINKLKADLRKACGMMSPAEARYLVDLYYQIQDNRIRAANQVRHTEEPTAVVSWVFENMRIVERNIKSALDAYSMGNQLGEWARSIHGVGPVIAAGLLAHIDLKIATNPSKIWRFAGLDPTVKWEKKSKRPWNARLKVLCWKLGDSFKKHAASEKCFYGHFYRRRKVWEVDQNDAGRNKAQADAALASKRITDPATLEIYRAGRLPAGRLDLRAMRWAVKIFLSHYHHVGHDLTHRQCPQRPWIISIGGHQDYIEVPNWHDCKIPGCLTGSRKRAV